MVFYGHAAAIASRGDNVARVKCLRWRHALQRLRHTDASHTKDGDSEIHSEYVHVRKAMPTLGLHVSKAAADSAELNHW